MRLFPDLAVMIMETARVLDAVGADHVEAAARRALARLDRMHAIPDGRIWLLEGRQEDRHVVVVELLAVKRQPVRLQALENHFKPFGVGVLRRLLAIVGGLDGRRAPAKAHVEPAMADVVEHADFLDQPQRLVERQGENQGPHAQRLRLRRDGG